MRTYIPRVHAVEGLPSLPRVPRTKFRWIPGFPGYAIGVGTEISVWSCKRQKGLGRPQSGFVSVLTNQWRKRALWTDKDGYLKLTLHSNGKNRFVGVNQLVLLAFVGPCPEGMQALHKNGNPADNHPRNLYWGTPQDNMDDRGRHGTTARGERGGRAKLAKADVLMIRNLHAQGKPFPEIARRYSIHRRHVGRIVRGESWSHVPEGINGEALP